MQVLFTSIYSKFSGDTAGLKAAITDLYLAKAIQGAVYPYCVYHKITGVPGYTFTEEMENVLIQFNIYDNNSSSTTVNDIYTKLTALYDWCSLTISGWNSIYMKREIDDLKNENDIWNYFIQYRLEIQK